MSSMAPLKGSFTARNIGDERLREWLNQNVKVFLLSGNCLTGRLLRYDAEVFELEGDRDHKDPTVIYRHHVTSIRQA
jgi:hypothetical protein